MTMTFSNNFLTTNLSNISWYRGDSFPIEAIVSNITTGARVDISGASFLFTVSSVKNPIGITEQLFQVVGIVAPNQSTNTGEVSFTPSSAQTGLTPGTYYFDVQMIDSYGHVRTISKYKFKVLQDNTKSVTSATEYSIQFDNTDLSSNILTVTHNLGDEYPVVTVYDNNNELVSVTVAPIDENSYTIDFGGAITGTWFIMTRVLSNRYTQSFDNTDLIINVLTVSHGLGTAYPSVSVYDSANTLASVTITSISTSSFSIDFGAGITGTWHLTAI